MSSVFRQAVCLSDRLFLAFFDFKLFSPNFNFQRKKCVFSSSFSSEERRLLFHILLPSLPHSFRIFIYFLSSPSSPLFFLCFSFSDSLWKLLQLLIEKFSEFYQDKFVRLSLLLARHIFLGFFNCRIFRGSFRVLNLKGLVGWLLGFLLLCPLHLSMHFPSLPADIPKHTPRLRFWVGDTDEI